MQPNVSGVYSPNGQAYPCFRFAKRNGCALAANDRVELRARGRERMAALKSDAAGFGILRVYSAAMRLVAVQADKSVVQQSQFGITPSKAEDLDPMARAGAFLEITRAARRLLCWPAYRPSLETGAVDRPVTTAACSDATDNVVEPVLVTAKAKAKAKGWATLADGAAQ